MSNKTNNINILNLYFSALYNLAKQDGYKYNIEKAIEIANKIENINNNKFQYTDKKEELKGLLRNYE